MRQIKFRGMGIDGTFHYGNLAVIENGFIKPGSYISNSLGVPFAYRVRPETVGQFTGLVDKNGKDIYEGDIVKSKNAISHPVKFDHGAFLWNGEPIAFDELTTVVMHPDEWAEVIGNIYHNPELIPPTA